MHDGGQDWRAVAEITLVASQHRADARHVENPDIWVKCVEPLQQCLIKIIETPVAKKRAAAAVTPRARDRSQTARRVQVGGAVPRAGEALPEA